VPADGAHFQVDLLDLDGAAAMLSPRLDTVLIPESVSPPESLPVLRPSVSIFPENTAELSPIDSPFELMPVSPVPPPVTPVLTPNPGTSPVHESFPLPEVSSDVVKSLQEPSPSLSPPLEVSRVDIRVSPDASSEHRSSDSSEFSFQLQPSPSDVGSVHLDTDLSDLDAFLARPLQISCPVSPLRSPSEEKCPSARLDVPDLVQSCPAPVGSLSASLSSPSEAALPDLAPVTPPRAVSPLSPLAHSVDDASERRARALQVIQENSEILQRIVQQPPAPGATPWGPFPRPRQPNREAGLRLGLYRKD
jgi:hypothetical protein